MYPGTSKQIAFRGRLIEFPYDELKIIEEERGQGETLEQALERMIVEMKEEKRQEQSQQLKGQVQLDYYLLPIPT
jgi:hypothetical protein